MLKTCFSLASVATLGGMVWMGCSSSDDVASDPGGDAGNPSQTKDSGGVPDDDSGGNPSDKDAGEDSGGKPGVTITYGKCPTFEKCASSPIGSWKVSGGCLSEDTFAQAKAGCAGLQESNVVIKASGTVVVDATNVKRDTTTDVSAHLLIPQSCSPIPDPNCTLIPTGLTSGILGQKFDKAECKVAGANCDCDVEIAVIESTNDTYQATPDGTLTTNDGAKDRTFDFCVKPITTLTFQETTAESLPFIVEVTK